MRFDQTKELMQSEYDLFLTSLKNSYLNFVAPGKTVDVNTITQLKADAAKASASFVARFSALAGDFVAVEGENLSESDTETLQGMVDSVVQKVAIIVAHNGATVVKALRESSGLLASSVKDDYGTIGKLIGKRIGEVKFQALDEANRKWDASKLFGFYARNMLYAVQTSASILAAKESGFDLMEIYYDGNPDHKNAGVIFSITGETVGYPKLEDIEKEIFHFNAKAEIRPYVFS